jgi:hypothetical protein
LHCCVQRRAAWQCWTEAVLRIHSPALTQPAGDADLASAVADVVTVVNKVFTDACLPLPGGSSPARTALPGRSASLIALLRAVAQRGEGCRALLVRKLMHGNMLASWLGGLSQSMRAPEATALVWLVADVFDSGGELPAARVAGKMAAGWDVSMEASPAEQVLEGLLGQDLNALSCVLNASHAPLQVCPTKVCCKGRFKFRFISPRPMLR